MSKTNTNVSVNYDEGLYYVSYADIYMYNETKNPNNIVTEANIPQGREDEFEFNPDMSQARYDAFRKKLADAIVNHFPSMQAESDKFADKRGKKRIVASNKLFEVVLEDNRWSVAVELKRVKKGKAGLQTQMFPSFLAGVRKALFDQFDTIYVRNGSWDSIPIDANSPADAGNTFINPETAYCRPEPKQDDQRRNTQPAYAEEG